MTSLTNKLIRAHYKLIIKELFRLKAGPRKRALSQLDEDIRVGFEADVEEMAQRRFKYNTVS